MLQPKKAKHRKAQKGRIKGQRTAWRNGSIWFIRTESARAHLA